MELHSGCRILLSVVTIGEADNLRSRSVDEVIHALVAVITCSVSHIGIVSHLILIAQTPSNLVIAHIICKVVLHIGDGVVDSIVPCEKFISESHIGGGGTGAVEYVDERELI